MKIGNLANQRDPKVRLEALGFSWGALGGEISIGKGFLFGKER